MKKALLIITALFGTLSAARAGIILSDNFQYNDGPVAQPTAATINPSSTWFANTGSGTGKDMDVTNQTLIVTGSRSEDMAHTLVGYPYPTNGPTVALYSSYVLKCIGLPNTSGSYFSHFSGTNAFLNGPPNLAGFRARVWSSLTNYPTGTGVGVGQFRLGIVNSGTDGNGVSLGSTNYAWPTPLDTNVSYTVVTRYVLATGIATLWINPNAETDPGVTDPNPAPLEPTNFPPTNGVLPISCYSFRQASGIGTMLINNLKVGTQFSDVAGSNQAPTISSIPNQAIPANGTTGPIPFQVSDAETPANQLVVTTASDNLTLIPNGSPNIVTNGDAGGTNRTITITPAAGQQGSANVAVTVSDGGNSSMTSFKVTVGAPSVGVIPTQIAKVSTPTAPVAFTVADAEGDALTLSASSSNPTLVTAGDIHFGVAVPNVSSNLTVTPEAGQTGTATITVSVADAHNTTTTKFVVTVGPSLGVVFSEPFDYPDGSLYGQGPWVHASPTGTNFGQLQVVSGQAQLARTQVEDLAASLNGGPYAANSGVVLYTGFKVTFTELPSAVGNYFFHLKDSDTGTTFKAKVFGSTTNAAPGFYRLGISSGANDPSPSFTRDLMLNQPYIVVSRYIIGTGETRFWVNPTSESSPSVDSIDNPSTASIGSVGLREDTGIGTNYIDNIVVSTSFADVIPSIVRPTLNIQASGGNVTLSWTDPSGLFSLQSSSTVSGGYTDVQGYTNPYTVPIGDVQFFRLRY